MPHISFDEFKSGFEFTLEVFGLSGVVVTAWYRFDVIRSVWDVARGRATREEQDAAVQGIRDMGAVAENFVRHLANHLQRHGHAEYAERLRGVSPSPRQDHARADEMV